MVAVWRAGGDFLRGLVESFDFYARSGIERRTIYSHSAYSPDMRRFDLRYLERSLETVRAVTGLESGPGCHIPALRRFRERCDSMESSPLA